MQAADAHPPRVTFEPITDPRWFVVAGGILVLMALAASLVRRLPLTAGVIYLAAGIGLSAVGAGLIDLDVLEDAPLIELLTELAVIVSLFTAGLKLRLPIRDRHWLLPVRLAFVAMAITVALVTVAGVVGLGLSLGAAVLLGGILAPTDPVLASDVQVRHPADRDRLRFALTGEAGLNDGTAFPVVLLGLGLLGLRDPGPSLVRWLTVDVGYATAAGLAIGAGLGTLVARLVLYLRRAHREAVGLDDFLALGLIGLSYGAALLVGAYGFLAVFAAGLALRRVERAETGDRPPADVVGSAAASEEAATDPERAPAYMAEAVLGFQEQLERIAEVAIVLVVGALVAATLTEGRLPVGVLWFVPLLFLGLRPLAVIVGMAGSGARPTQVAFIAWFGLRGVGSLYYLAFALTHGFTGPEADTVRAVALVTVAASIVVHGISVTPLMERYERWRRRSRDVEVRAA